MSIQIITDRLFKEVSPISKETDLSDIRPFIIIAQDMHIRPIIGDALYLEIQQQVNDNNLTEINGDLIKKISMCLGFYTMFQMLPFHGIKIVNAGVVQNRTVNSDSVDFKNLEYLRRHIITIADHQADEVVRYLCNCKTKYPLWNPYNSNCCDKFKPTGGNANTPYESGIFIPKKYRKCNGCED